MPEGGESSTCNELYASTFAFLQGMELGRRQASSGFVDSDTQLFDCSQPVNDRMENGVCVQGAVFRDTEQMWFCYEIRRLLNCTYTNAGS